jgi:hypothetical protein
LNIQYFKFKLDIDDPEDKLVYDKIFALRSEKRSVKIAQILFEYYKDKKENPTEKQLLNMVDNFVTFITHQPNTNYIVKEPEIKPIIETYTKPEVEISIPIAEEKIEQNPEVKINYENINFDSLIKTDGITDNTIDEKSLLYLKDIYKKNMKEF